MQKKISISKKKKYSKSTLKTYKFQSFGDKIFLNRIHRFIDVLLKVLISAIHLTLCTNNILNIFVYYNFHNPFSQVK